MKFILAVSKTEPSDILDFVYLENSLKFKSFKIPFLGRSWFLDFLPFKYEIVGSNLSITKRLKHFLKINGRNTLVTFSHSRNLSCCYLIIILGNHEYIDLKLKRGVKIWISLQAQANGLLNSHESVDLPAHYRKDLDFCLYYVFNNHNKLRLGRTNLRNSLNAFLDPLEILDISEQLESQQRFVDAKVFFGKSVVYNNHLIVSSNFSKLHLDKFPENRILFFGKYAVQIRAESTRRLDSAVFIDLPFNWYHFWIDSFPQILRGVENLEAQIPLLVPHGLPPQIREILNELFDVAPIEMARYEVVEVKELICIKQYLKGGQVDYMNKNYSTNPFQNILEDLNLSRDWVKKYFSDTTPSAFGKVFLSRQNETSRKLKNRGEVESTFQMLGFKVIYPEFLTFREQLNIISGAKIIAGESGAGLTGLLFANPDSQALILKNHDDTKNSNFWSDFASTLGIQSSVCVGIKSVGFEHTGDWSLDISTLRRIIENMPLV